MGKTDGARAPAHRGGFLMTPAQHRATAKLLRAHSDPKAKELAVHHDQLASMIERRRASNAGFLCSPRQHRETAARIRQRNEPDSEERAKRFEDLAKVIERREAARVLH